MPLLQVQTSSSTALPAGWLKAMSTELSRQLGKPEAYVMVIVTRAPDMLFAGSPDPCCFGVLKNIGTFTPDRTEKLAALLCDQLAEGLGMPRGRIYLEFADAKPHLWGYDGATFA